MKLNNYKIKVPPEGKDEIQFKNYLYKERLLFVIYADCECLLKPVQENEKGAHINTLPFQENEILSIGYYIKCSYDDSLSLYKSYRGVKPSLWFATELKMIEERITNLYKNPKPMSNLTTAEWIAHHSFKICYICKKLLEENKIKIIVIFQENIVGLLIVSVIYSTKIQERFLLYFII